MGNAHLSEPVTRQWAMPTSRVIMRSLLHLKARTMTTTKQLIRVGHSPDPDDAFMFYALAKGQIDCGRV